MHIMCVRGVYVTDPANNIIFGGKCPALVRPFLRLVFSRFLGRFPIGSTFSLFCGVGAVSFDVFRVFFRMLLWPASGAHFFYVGRCLKLSFFFFLHFS